jgi:uncharacterized membrane protein
MGKIKERLFQFVWNLSERRRVLICLSLGVAMAVLVNRLLGWTVQLSFLSGWNLALGSYLILSGVVLVTADGTMTQRRASQHEPNQKAMMVFSCTMSIFGTGMVGVVLTAVGKHPVGHSHLLLILSLLAMILAWLLLHSAFAVHYARLYHAARDIHGRPFTEGRRSGFHFPGTENPTYLDFLYVSFTVALTYSMSDVNVENEVMRRTVLLHSLLSFFFYTVVLAGALNAVITS